MKFNPFRPGSIVRPGMFAGRVDEIEDIEKCLFQTKHGNPQNFLICGERGIGKSSLMIFAEHVARGNLTFNMDEKVNFLVLSIELKEKLSSYEFLQTLANKFKSELNLRKEVQAKAKAVWEFVSKWEVLGVKYRGQGTEVDPVTLSDELALNLKEVIEKSAGAVDGIAVFIDEADKADESTQLGETLKLLTEKITKLGCDQVVVGLAGLPELKAKLKESHASSPRIFQILDLKPLEPEERKEVANKGIAEANRKNKVETKITEEALDYISELSEGYPHFMQQFAYSAFEADTDDNIDKQDVENGAFKENGALDQLGHKYFQEHFYENVGTDDYRRVLEAMAQHDNKWVTRAQIIDELKEELQESQIDNGLKSLKAKQIIVPDPKTRGSYRLPTKSFATWIKVKALEAAREERG